jgi:hypothetical protein
VIAGLEPLRCGEGGGLLFARVCPDLSDADRPAASGHRKSTFIGRQDLSGFGVRTGNVRKPGIEKADLLPLKKGVRPRLGVAAPDKVVDLRRGFRPVDPGDPVVTERFVGGKAFVLDQTGRPSRPDQIDGLRDCFDAEGKEPVEVEGTCRVRRPDGNSLLEEGPVPCRSPRPSRRSKAPSPGLP